MTEYTLSFFPPFQKAGSLWKLRLFRAELVLFVFKIFQPDISKLIRKLISWAKILKTSYCEQSKPYIMYKQIQNLIFWAIYGMGPSFSVHPQLWMPWGGKLDVEGFALIGLLVILRAAPMETETTCQGQIQIAQSHCTTEVSVQAQIFAKKTHTRNNWPVSPDVSKGSEISHRKGMHSI